MATTQGRRRAGARLVPALAAVALFGCANRVELEADRELSAATTLPAECVPPQFAAGECRADVVNDGAGPDDQRTLCDVNGEHWALYPSGEAWHWVEPDGKQDPTLCHLAADGSVLWRRSR